MFLISPRRYGKSSLVRDVMRSLARQKILTVEVTVASSSSYVGFLESYARALVAADTPAGRLKRWAADLFSAIKPELRFDRRTSQAPAQRASSRSAFPAVRTARDTARVAAEVFALPGRIAEARKQRLAIALDEFQAITVFDGGTRRARAARRGAGSAPGRLRVLRLRAVADGAHARAAPAVLQGRPGDAAREDRPG